MRISASVKSLLIATVLLIQPPANASNTYDAFGQKNQYVSDSIKTEFIFSPRYAVVLGRDMGHVFSAPLHWKEKNWLEFSLKTVSVAGTMLLLDRPVRDFAQRNRNETTDDIARFFEPFGRHYPFAISSGFYLTGLIFDKANARATGLDGFAASLIASEMITPGLKQIFGRSRPWQNRGEHHYHPFSGDDSFPSGHSTRAFMLASVISAHYKQGWIRWTAYGVAVMVALARIDYDLHYLSDVLVGGIIGVSVGKTIVKFNHQLRIRK